MFSGRELFNRLIFSAYFYLVFITASYALAPLVVSAFSVIRVLSGFRVLGLLVLGTALFSFISGDNTENVSSSVRLSGDGGGSLVIRDAFTGKVSSDLQARIDDAVGFPVSISGGVPGIMSTLPLATEDLRYFITGWTLRYITGDTSFFPFAASSPDCGDGVDACALATVFSTWRFFLDVPTDTGALLVISSWTVGTPIVVGDEVCFWSAPSLGNTYTVSVGLSLPVSFSARCLSGVSSMTETGQWRVPNQRVFPITTSESLIDCQLANGFPFISCGGIVGSRDTTRGLSVSEQDAYDNALFDAYGDGVLTPTDLGVSSTGTTGSLDSIYSLLAEAVGQDAGDVLGGAADYDSARYYKFRRLGEGSYSFIEASSSVPVVDDNDFYIELGSDGKMFDNLGSTPSTPPDGGDSGGVDIPTSGDLPSDTFSIELPVRTDFGDVAGDIEDLIENQLGNKIIITTNAPVCSVSLGTFFNNPVNFNLCPYGDVFNDVGLFLLALSGVWGIILVLRS